MALNESKELGHLLGIVSAAKVCQGFRDAVDPSGVGHGIDADRFFEFFRQNIRRSTGSD